MNDMYDMIRVHFVSDPYCRQMLGIFLRLVVVCSIPTVFLYKISVRKSRKWNSKPKFFKRYNPLTDNGTIPVNELIELREETKEKLPKLKNLKIVGGLWQKVTSVNGSVVYLLSAFYDPRPVFLTKRPKVMIIASFRVLEKVYDLYCTFWFKGRNESLTVKISMIRTLRGAAYTKLKMDGLKGYWIICTMPNEENDIPTLVSITGPNKKRPSNVLKVVYDPEPQMPKKGIALCVKGLYFPHKDVTSWLIDWIELNLILGASKIFIYVTAIVPKVRRVLDFYEAKGVVETLKFTLPGKNVVNKEMRKSDMEKWDRLRVRADQYAYNDCFYRYRNQFKYIAAMDLDEIVMPQDERHRNWYDMIESASEDGVDPSKVDALAFKHVYLFSKNKTKFVIGPDMLHQDWRSEKVAPIGFQTKLFFNTNTSVMIFNHRVMMCVNSDPTAAEMKPKRGTLQMKDEVPTEKQCATYFFPRKLGLLYHYRKTCIRKLNEVCEDQRAKRILDEISVKYRNLALVKKQQSLREMSEIENQDLR